MQWKKAFWVAVIGLAVTVAGVWLGSFYLQKKPSFKLTFEYQADHFVWSCKKYGVKFPASSIAKTVSVSTTLGKIYSSEKCEVNTVVSSVNIDPSSKSATFYLWSYTDGTAEIKATAQEGGAFGKSFYGTTSVGIQWPDTVPPCKKSQGGTCKGMCTDPQPVGGIFYTRIPYTNQWYGGPPSNPPPVCCPWPKSPGPPYYQLYGEEPATICKKQ